MIDVEIRGPVAKKEYDKLFKTLTTAGDGQYLGHQIALTYSDKGHNNREVRIEHKNGTAKIFVAVGKTGAREEIVTQLASGGFSDAVKMFAELGYKKGTVTVQKVFSANYGGARFSIYGSDGDAVYYEAVITTKGPTEAKEAKGKLEKLARNFKLPMWTPLHMLEFMRRLHETLNYMYDYSVDGPNYFKNRFEI